MMGDGTEEQNLGERGNPTARIKKNEVAAAFNKARKAKQDDQFPSTASQCGDDNRERSQPAGEPHSQELVRAADRCARIPHDFDCRANALQRFFLKSGCTCGLTISPQSANFCSGI